MLQGKVILIIFICTSSLYVAFSHDPGRSHSGQYRTRGQTTPRGPVFPRCLLEKTSAFTLRMINPGSRNVTSFVPRCGLDHSFRCHQKWSAVGLSWQSNKEGRMVENTLTRGKTNCPNKKGSLNFKNESKLKEEKDEEEEEESNIRWYDEMIAICLNTDVGNETKSLGNSSQDFGDDESGRETDDVDDTDYSDDSDPADDDADDDDDDGDAMDDDTDVMDADDHVMDDYDDVDDDDDNDDDDGNVDDDNGEDDDDGDDNDDDDDGDGEDNDDGDDDDNDDDDDDDDDDDFDDGRGMTRGRDHRREPGHNRRRRRHRHHFSQLNWIQQQDLYEEFKFNPPSVCPKDQPMQSNCRPTLCKLVKCGEDKNISCRINPCGNCRPECYDVKGNTAMPPRVLTKCEYRRVKMKFSRYSKVAVIPRCNKDGSFKKVQCLAATKWCWCVDEHGQERSGTRQRGKPTSCKFSGPVLSECQSTQLNIEGLKDYLSKIAVRCNATANNMKHEAKTATQWMQQRPTTRGLRNRTMGYQIHPRRVCRMLAREARREGKHLIKPKCASDGRFENIQCGSSNQTCWCVDENGKRKSSVKARNKLNCSNSEGHSSSCPLQMTRGEVQSSACRDSSDCPDSKVCCKTRRSGRKCVEPPSRIPTVKPGKCPIIPRSSNYTCRSRCKSDTDCRGNRKCCELGCGKRCLPPNMPVCPRDKPFKLCIYDKCLSSPGCAIHPSAKCRMNYCGKCSAEYFDENDDQVDCSRASKCQKQRHAAIESYKRKYLQLFNTLPLHLPGAPLNTSREAERHMGNQSGIHSGGKTEGQRGGQRRTSVGGWHGGRSGRTGGDQRNGQGRYAATQGSRRVTGRGQGSHAGGRNQSRVDSGGSQHLGQGGFRENGRSAASDGGQPGFGSQHERRRHGGMGGHRRGGHHGGAGAGGRRYDRVRRQAGGRWRRMRLQRGSRVGGGGHWRNGRWCHGKAGRTHAGQDRNGRHQRHRESQKTDLGIFIPECHPEDGSFLSEQCNVTSGVCWCVNKDGEEKPNTRAQVQRGTRECGKLHVETNTLREKKRVARLSFSLAGNFGDLVGNQEQFINNVKEKVSSVCGCKKEQIRNVKILPGSIKVKMEIVAEDDGNSLEESIQLLKAEIKFLRFVIIFNETEYRADGSFKVHLIDHHHANDSGRPKSLSLAEITSIASCVTAFLLVILFFAWKYFGRSKKKMPEGWKDMVKAKPPEVHYVTFDS